MAPRYVVAPVNTYNDLILIQGPKRVVSGEPSAHGLCLQLHLLRRLFFYKPYRTQGSATVEGKLAALKWPWYRMP